MFDSIVPIVRRLRSRGLLAAAAAAMAAGLGGCSSVPDAANPVEWYKGTRDWIVGADESTTARADAAKPVPGAEKPFPKLATVPDRPFETTEAERRRMANSLTADRDAARYTDEEIRRQTSDVAADPRAPAAAEPKQEPTPEPRMAEARIAPPPVAPPTEMPAATRRGPAVMNQSASVDPAARRPAPPAVVAPTPQSPPPARASGTIPQVPSAPPPPPAISPVVTAGQPIPVTPSPDAGQATLPGAEFGYPETAGLPPNVRVAHSRRQATAVQADRFSPRFPAGATARRGPVQATPTLPPLASLPPELDVAPAAGFAPGAVIPPSAGVTSDAARQPPLGSPVATIRFGVGSARIGAEDRRKIREAYEAWQSRGGRIHVVGHASSRTRNLNRASHELANFKVSYDRARAVAQELVNLGVDPQQIVVSAMSDHKPAFVEVMPAGEAGNRRAEIILAN